MKVLIVLAIAAVVSGAPDPRPKRSFGHEFSPLLQSLQSNSLQSSSYQTNSLQSTSLQAVAQPTYHAAYSPPVYNVQPSYAVSPQVETYVVPQVYNVQAPATYTYPIRQQAVYRAPVQTYTQSYTPVQTYQPVQTYAPYQTYTPYQTVQTLPVRTYSTWQPRNADPWC